MAFVERRLENVVWDTPGTKVKGILMKITRVKFDDGGSALRYAVVRSDATVVVFPGATNLDSRLTPTDLGSNVHVEYLGEDDSRTMAAGRSKPKMFKVMVDSSAKVKPAPASDGTEVTDDDIPF